MRSWFTGRGEGGCCDVVKNVNPSLGLRDIISRSEYVKMEFRLLQFTEILIDLSIYRVSIKYIYRVSIKSFPYYKHLLQENYVEYKYSFFFSKCNLSQEVFLQLT